VVADAMTVEAVPRVDERGRPIDPATRKLMNTTMQTLGRVALIGAFAFALLQEFFKSEAVFGTFAKHWHLGLGLTIIASVALLPRGLVGVPGQIRGRLFGGRTSTRSGVNAAGVQDEAA